MFNHALPEAGTHEATSSCAADNATNARARQCDACGQSRPCVTRPRWPCGIETYACHACRGLQYCDDCGDEYDDGETNEDDDLDEHEEYMADMLLYDQDETRKKE